jgi:general secretion pathway protein J
MKKMIPGNIIRTRGFTLIEILISMVLLSMILLLLFSSLYTANKYWQMGEKTVEQNEETRLVNHFIRRLIIQTVPILWVDDGEKKLLFQGKQDELRFVSTLPAHRGGGGLHTLILKVVTTDSTKQLGLTHSLLDPDIEPFSDLINEEEFITIANDIDTIKLSYFGKLKKDEEAQWFEEWDSEIYIPQLVRLRIHPQNHLLNRINDWPVIDIPIQASFVQGQPEFMIQTRTSL